jgi:hypothetical protein
MQRRFSISTLGSVYDARCEPNLPTLSNMKLPTAETMQTIEEALFANRKTKEKNAPSN